MVAGRIGVQDCDQEAEMEACQPVSIPQRRSGLLEGELVEKVKARLIR
jgi:hypothetical protein